MAKLSETEVEARKLFVYAACNALLARGEKPRSARHVRGEMERMRPDKPLGDTAYVQRFLQEWRRDREAQSGDIESTIISGALLHAIKAELHSQAVKLKAECDDRIDGMVLDAQEMFGLNSKLELEIAQLQDDIAQRSTERDEALGALTECRTHLSSAHALLADAQGRQEKAAEQLAASIAARLALEARCAASQKAASEAQQAAESLQAELDVALAAGRAALQRATSAEAAAQELLATAPLSRFLKPGRNIASKPQRFKQGLSPSLRRATGE